MRSRWILAFLWLWAVWSVGASLEFLLDWSVGAPSVVLGLLAAAVILRRRAPGLNVASPAARGTASREA